MLMNVSLMYGKVFMKSWYLFSVTEEDVWGDASECLYLLFEPSSVSLYFSELLDITALSIVHILIKWLFFITEWSYGTAANKRLVWQEFKLGGELDQLVGSQHHPFLVVVLDGLVLSSSSQQGEDEVL